MAGRLVRHLRTNRFRGRGARLFVVFVAALLVSRAAGQEEDLTRIKPTPAAQAPSTFRSSDGFRVELLAAEPLVQDPVVLKYDEDGRAFVAEMADYPYTDRKFDRPWSDQPSPPAGRIRVLTDEDGDGVFDRSVIFVDGISWPTGLAFWKGGVYVAATPDLWYFKDTDGDLRADVRRRVFTGFRKYNVQAVMNNLQWGPDHYIYGAGGSNGGTITAPGRPDVPPVVLGRHDFRFDPRREILEVLPGGARFGNTFDDWGDRFICNIRNPLRYCLLPGDAAARQLPFPPDLAVVDAAPSGDLLPVYRISPPEPWRVINARRLAADRHRYSPRSEMNATGYVTSACGVTIYRGAAYPSEYRGNAFIAEVAGNLVMRYRLHKEGVLWKAEHVLKDGRREFLASTDNWHRPVNFTNAPDGTLHLVDMYRQTIEHPWSIPDDLKARLDLLRGRRKGRIYRLVPPEYAAGYQPPPRPRLSRASTLELVQLLDSSHSWWRDTAQRLLWERRDPTAAEAIRKLITERPTPRTVATALWTLDGLGALQPADLTKGAASPDANLRRHVVRLAARHASDDAAFRSLIIRGASDTDVSVRFESALGLAAWSDTASLEALSALALRDGTDPILRAAVVAAARGREAALLERLLALFPDKAGKGGPEVVTALLPTVVRKPAGRLEVLGLLAEADRRAGNHRRPETQTYLWQWAATAARSGAASSLRKPQAGPGATWLAGIVAQAERVAVDRLRPAEMRVAAVQLLAARPVDEVRDALLECLEPDQPLSVQEAALEVLMARGVEAAPVVLDQMSVWSPTMQREAVLRLLSRPESTRMLLEAIDNRRLRVESIPLRYRSRLRSSKDARVRELAEKVLGEAVTGDRAAVVQRYREALVRVGDPRRGREVFRRECRSCHRFRGEGAAVGPQLESVLHRSPLELLTHILDPDREVAPEFQRYAVRTKEGVLHSGIIGSETAEAITLVDAEERRVVIRREAIEAIRADPHSLMPNGLEEKITVEQMADLLAYLTGRSSR